MEGQSSSDSSNDSTPPSQFSMKMQRFPNRKINSRSVNFANNDIFNDDDSFTRSSMASDYVYHKTVEEKKKWDCAVTNVEEAGSASELHMGKKI